jgi:hypothetical protein
MAITAAWAARPPSQALAPAQAIQRRSSFALRRYRRAAAIHCAPHYSCCSTPFSLFSLAAPRCSRCSCCSALLCCALIVLSFCSVLVLFFCVEAVATITFFALVSFLRGDHVPISVAELCHAQVLDVGGTGILHVAALGFGLIYSSIPTHLERVERRRELDLVGALVAGRAEGFVGTVDYCHLIRPTYTAQCCIDTHRGGICWHERCAGLWRTSLHLLSDSKHLVGLRLD